MAIVSIKNKTKSGSLLVGNAFFDPAQFQSIASATGTGSSGTITFSSIPSTFTHLQVRFNGRTTRTTNLEGYSIRYNGDSGTNYAYHTFYGDGSVAVVEGITASTGGIIGWTATDFHTSSVMGVSITDIFDYNSTSKNKVSRAFTGYDGIGSGREGITSSVWLSTAAITSLSLVTNSGFNWTTDTTVALYGIKAD
jgi:hypothetical protein